MAADPERAFFGGELEDTEPMTDEELDRLTNQAVKSPHMLSGDVLNLIAELRRFRPLASKGESGGDYRSPSRERRALRRLQNAQPTEFERVIDMFYLWQEVEPRTSVTEIMRKIFQSQHQNISDKDMIKAMDGLIKEVRLAKITFAINKLGLDDAERLLGLKKDE